jgi:hypothetical protein
MKIREVNKTSIDLKLTLFEIDGKVSEVRQRKLLYHDSFRIACEIVFNSSIANIKDLLPKFCIDYSDMIYSEDNTLRLIIGNEPNEINFLVSSFYARSNR